MDQHWMADLRQRHKRGNQVLFTKSSVCLLPLQQQLAQLSHRAVVLWALELAEQAVETLRQRYPEEHRPAEALQLSRDWAAGRVKMRPAQRAILDAHAFAKEIDSPEDIALVHAVGQACGTVHTAGHAIGFPMYELTAMVRRLGPDHCREEVERRIEHYGQRLRHWETQAKRVQTDWADFLLRD